MALAAVHRTVTVGDESLTLKVVYEEDRDSEMPCVVFLSGADCPHESYMWLASRLAHAGCAVALSTCVVPFGAGTCLLSVPFDMSALGSLEAYKRNPSAAGLGAILDALRQLSAESDGPLAGRLDLTKLSVGGHSSGGRTALDLAAFDNPFGFGAVFSYGASLVNLAGSTLFLLASVTYFVQPPKEWAFEVSLWGVRFGFAMGSACFVVGAWLALLESLSD